LFFGFNVKLFSGFIYFFSDSSSMPVEKSVRNRTHPGLAIVFIKNNECKPGPHATSRILFLWKALVIRAIVLYAYRENSSPLAS